MLETVSASLAGRTAAILTASDRCFSGTMTDRSGPGLRHLLEAEGAHVLDSIISPDEIPVLVQHLRSLIAARVHLIITTGGTGLSPRDVTPEATLAVCERLAPGLAEYLRASGMKETPYAILSRGVCGIAAESLIINLPGSISGALSGLERILPLLPHALDLVAGASNHAEEKTSDARQQS